MSPPIRDGSGSSIGSIRLGDGSEIAEVRTGAGDVVFDGGAIPDSAISQYDPFELSLSDGADVDPWPDEIGSFDLSAGVAPEFVSSGINGNPTVSTADGEYLDVSYGSSFSQPNTIIFAMQLPTVSNNTAIFDGVSNRHMVDIKNDSYRLFAGSGITGGTADTDPHIISAIFDGGDSELRVDQNVVVTGDAGSDSLDGLTVGADAGQNQSDAVDLGEGLPYDADLRETNDLESEEQRIADLYGISLA